MMRAILIRNETQCWCAMKKCPREFKPKRGYLGLVAAWIFAISLFIAIKIIINGEVTYGEPDGVLITAAEHPFMYWAAVAFPIVVAVVMVVIVTRAEIEYRTQLQTYRQLELENVDQE